MVKQAERDELIKQILALLEDAQAQKWTVQDKGVLLAAIKLQLKPSTET